MAIDCSADTGKPVDLSHQSTTALSRDGSALWPVNQTALPCWVFHSAKSLAEIILPLPAYKALSAFTTARARAWTPRAISPLSVHSSGQ